MCDLLTLKPNIRSVRKQVNDNCSLFPYLSMLVFRTMKYNYERFDIRMSQQEREALEKLAEYEGITMSKWVKNRIRQSAKRKKVWK